MRKNEARYFVLFEKAEQHNLKAVDLIRDTVKTA